MPLMIRAFRLAVYLLICSPALTLHQALVAAASAAVFRRMLALCPGLPLDAVGERAVEAARLAVQELRFSAGNRGKPSTGDAVVVFLLPDPTDPPPQPPTAGGRGRLRPAAGASQGARETARRVAHALRQIERRAA